MVFWDPWTGLSIKENKNNAAIFDYGDEVKTQGLRIERLTNEARIKKDFFNFIEALSQTIKKYLIGITEFIKNRSRTEEIVITEINQQIVSGSMSGIPNDAVNLRGNIFKRRTSIEEFNKLVKKYKRLFPNFPIKESTLDIVRRMIEIEKERKDERDQKFIEKELKKFREKEKTKKKQKKKKKKKKISGKRPEPRKIFGKIGIKKREEKSNLNINFLADIIKFNLFGIIGTNISRNMLKRMEENLT